MFVCRFVILLVYIHLVHLLSGTFQIVALWVLIEFMMCYGCLRLVRQPGFLV